MTTERASETTDGGGGEGDLRPDLSPDEFDAQFERMGLAAPEVEDEPSEGGRPVPAPEGDKPEPEPEPDGEGEGGDDKAAEAAEGDKKDAQPERDYEREYQNQLAATREARAEIKRLSAIVDQLAGRDRQSTDTAKAEEKKPDDPLAGFPDLDKKYDDPLEELAALRAGMKQLADQRRAEVEARTRTTEEEARRTEADQRRSEWIGDVAQRVAARLPEDASAREDFLGEGGAYQTVLSEHARVIYNTNQHYLDQGVSPQKLAEWAYRQANFSLHREADHLMDAGKNPIDALRAEAQRFGWQAPSAKAAAEKAAAEKAEAEKRAALEKDGKKAKEREAARETLSTSLSKSGRSDGGGIQSFQDLADAAAAGEMSGEDFDKYFERLGGIA